MSTKEASRRSPQDTRWAIAVKERAWWRCEFCGMSNAEIKAAGGELWACHEAPHWEFPEKALDLDNGKALCTFLDPKHRHPQGKGFGFGCHNSLSGHWGKGNGLMAHSGRITEHRHKPMKRHKLPAFAALFATGILSTSHGLPHHALWGWGALVLSLALWPELGIGSALWVVLLALGFHFHRLHAPLTFGGWLGWMAALVGAWLACLGASMVGLAHLPRLWGRVWR